MRFRLGAAAAVGAAVALVPAPAVPARPVVASATTAPAVVAPPVNGRFDYQIGGSYRPARGVQIVDRDRTSHPATGRYNICYVNALQTQTEQDRWWRRHHGRLLLHDRSGRLVEDPGWPGEYLLDVSTAGSRHRLAHIIGRWVEGCARHGFDAVEPDNLDSYSRSHHLLTLGDDLSFARLLTRRAHRVGLAVAQKNTAELGSRGRRRAGFDFAIAEECEVYHECSSYLHAYGDRVLEVEYSDDGRQPYHRACAARGGRISVILRDRDVVPRGRPRYVYLDC